ncbi:MAG: putative cytokinetic ring protein SteA [Bacillota bacterium]
MIRGKARADIRTKNLVKRIKPNEIAIIDHEDIDQIAAESLVRARVKAVINASSSISGRYPTPGPKIIIDAGIPLVDQAGREIMKIPDGETIELQGGQILLKGAEIARGHLLTDTIAEAKIKKARNNISGELDNFVQNTLEYALKEKELILGLAIPEVNTDFIGRHVVVVVRGRNYREDLMMLKPYLAEVKPLLIGVDGGADALLEFNMIPDMIIGDMDSISDEALFCGAELVVHAYPDGRAPGLARLNQLNLQAKKFPAPGTSEDIALLLAYEKGAELIVALGTHSNMIDFLEKGRNGMASTFLVRLKVGSRLIDARGVSRLYKVRGKFRYLLQVVMAAMIPVIIIALVSEPVQRFWQLLKFFLRTSVWKG